MRPRVVELSVSLAMDRKASHRELTSVLISDLYGKAISAKDIQMGFDGLLNNLKDITIDSPEAPKVSQICASYVSPLQGSGDILFFPLRLCVCPSQNRVRSIT